MSEPLVLLPGMMCDARLFGPQIAELSPLLDLHIGRVNTSDSVTEIAFRVLENAPAKFALAGLSMGAIVAMEVYRQAPSRVTRLCLMATNCLPDTPQVAAAREPLIATARTGRLDKVMAEAMKPEFLAPGPQRTEVLHLVNDMARYLGPEAFIRAQRALQRRPDQQSTLRRIRKTPTLILGGRHDALCPVRRHEFMATLVAGADLKILENSGHLPTLEQPEETSSAILEWMQKPLLE